MALAVGGMLVLPGCENWTTKSVTLQDSFLSLEEDELLAEIVGTIIPATDTPGAKELQVHKFVQKMLEDCFEKEVQQKVVNGLGKIEKMADKSYGKPFKECAPEQKEALLRALEQGDYTVARDYYTVLKKLTIQGYLTSEYVMTNHSNYKMTPGFFHGCVPVSPKV